jgi:hypothetical protein
LVAVRSPYAMQYPHLKTVPQASHLNLYWSVCRVKPLWGLRHSKRRYTQLNSQIFTSAWRSGFLLRPAQKLGNSPLPFTGEQGHSLTSTLGCKHSYSLGQFGVNDNFLKGMDPTLNQSPSSRPLLVIHSGRPEVHVSQLSINPSVIVLHY